MFCEGIAGIVSRFDGRAVASFEPQSVWRKEEARVPGKAVDSYPLLLEVDFK
jgi:hypothetical protein